MVRFDAYPGLILDGKVEAVGHDGQQQPPGQLLCAACAGADRAGRHRPAVIPDLTANADVVLAEQDDVFLIPREAVQDAGGKSVVMVKQGESVVPREVGIGGYSNTQASVISGLQEGDQVALPYEGRRRLDTEGPEFKLRLSRVSCAAPKYDLNFRPRSCRNTSRLYARKCRSGVNTSSVIVPS